MVATPVTVRDITGREGEFTLDGCGFQLVRRETRSRACLEGAYRDEAVVKGEYYGEVEGLMKEV